jgi:tetratricopeptide (TPR) repeat protein
MLANFLKYLVQRRPRDAHRARALELFDAGTAQRERGDYDAARRSFEQAVALDPDHAGAHRWLALMLVRDQAYAAAIMHLEHALARDPKIPDGWVDLGVLYYIQRDLLKAAVCLRTALESDPDAVVAHTNLGVVLREAGRPEEALLHMRRAHELAPREEGAVKNLVLTLIEADRCEEALSAASGAFTLDPGSYETNLALGFAHYKLHEPAQALQYYDVAGRIRSDDAELYYNRGLALQDLGRLSEAFEDYERAIARQPKYPLALFHRALARLLTGDFERGWNDYEARRMSVHDFPQRGSALPQWDGLTLAGRTLLVHSEQGLGDEIMFASILPQVMAAAGHCIAECDPRLLALFRRSFPGATIYPAARDRHVPDEIVSRKVDVEVAAGSLPRFLRRRLEDFPLHEGYLKADPERVAYYRERLSQLGPGPKIGISWSGGVRKTRRPLRSIPLERWLPILKVPAARFVSLQYTPEAATQAAEFQERHGVAIEHWQEAIDDYDETAALVTALDLVVSVCTSVIHLGGALGRPVWVMAPRVPEWRYGFAGDRMPWYPSVKIYRQRAFGEWEPVISSVAAELGRLTGQPAG